jgi:hypothetical protein
LLKVVLAWFVAALLCVWALGANVSPDFTPIRAELANARGFSRGVLNLVVLPAAEPFTHAPKWSALVCAAVLLLLSTVRLKPDTTYDTAWDPSSAPAKALAGPIRLKPNTTIKVVAASGIALLAAVVLSPYVTPYRVVLAPRTFGLCLLLVCAAPAFRAVTWLRERWTPLMSGALCAAFFGSAMLQALATYGGNYSSFLHVSRDVADRAPFLQERPDLARSLVVYDAGYDGQFMYLMAFDPFLRRFADRPAAYRAFVDNPPYRYGRIGFSLLTDLVSAGQPERFPAAMMWLVVAAHFALGAILAAIAARHGLSPFAALWYLAIPGFTSSMMSALPEALAAAGIVAGMLCWQTERPGLAALAFGAALLVRETGVIIVVALVLTSRRQEWRRSVFVFLGALLPVCAWRLFVASRLAADFGWAAIFPDPGDLGVPFAGLLRLWQAGLGGGQPSPEVAAAFVFPLILSAAFVLAVSLLIIRRGPLEVAAAIYALVAVSLNYSHIWSHVPSGERGTFELFLCLLLLLLESKERPISIRRTLTAFFVVLIGYTFFLAPDAGTSRSALLLIR